jgi:hypothetical protein
MASIAAIVVGQAPAAMRTMGIRHDGLGAIVRRR